MNALKRAQYGSWALAAVVALALPIRGWAQAGDSPPQAQEEKSAEDILKKLLGAERGIGGTRVESQDTTSEQPRVAVPIHFNYNSAEITPDSLAQLDRVAQALNDPRLRPAHLRIEGHTDMLGSDAYNLRLSQRRADAVKQFLVQRKGIAASRLIVVLGGMGSVIGALVGGLFVGVVESLSGLWLGESLGQIGIFVMFILVLLFRPSGLFGERT